MCLLLRLPTGRQLTKAVMAAKLSNLGIKRQKSFTFANGDGDCSGGVALLPYGKGEVTCVILPFCHFCLFG